MEEPSGAFLLLSNHVNNFSVIAMDHDPRAYRIVECSSKAAYGCGPNGDAIVRGLTLLVRVGGGHDNPYFTPELRLRATDEVFRRVGSMLDVEKVKRCGSHTRLSSSITTVDGDVMVLCISFMPTFRADEVSYYLVYDSAAASLSLLPRLPRHCRTVCTEFPLMVKVGEEDNKYSLVLMAERSTSPSAKYRDPVLCLWSPPSPDDDDRRDYSRCAWDLKARVRVSVNAMPNPFEAHVVFSCKGRAVWGDLAQGMVYCDRGDLIDDDTEPVVFKHVMLPEECRTTYDIHEDPMPPVFRTMSCVGDSIWFLIIEPSSFTCPGDTTVKLWTLDLARSEEWSLHREFKMQSVCELEVFRAWGLPETAPEFPFFRRHKDVDGAALYMFLLEPYAGGLPYAHLVCIDLSGSSLVVRLVSSTRLVFPLMERPVVMDPDFFSPRHTAVFEEVAFDEYFSH